MKKILIIEDNNDIRENLVEFLELSGYETISADNGKKGIEMTKEFKPDLIICDVIMPTMNGYEVLCLLLETTRINDIPFIFSSSKAEKSDYAEGMELGADDYMIKPFGMETLLIRLETCLQSGCHRHNCVEMIEYITNAATVKTFITKQNKVQQNNRLIHVSD